MEEIILEGIERAKKTGKFKESGFVPGVLYGDSVAGATSVKFEEKALNKVLSSHGANTKIWVNIKDNKKFGFIKEVQREPLSRKVSHIDVQIVSKDHEIKLQIPINFKGEENLKSRQLQLQIHKAEIHVFGKMALIPDKIEVDVSEMNLGDTIILNDFGLDKMLKIESDDAFYATIVNLKVQLEEVAEETEVKEEIK